MAKPGTEPPAVVITGASAGVGRATARAFATIGASVGLIARDKSRLEETAREVEHLGGQALVLVADVSDPDQVERAASEMEQRFGRIDVWVNNAMVSVFSPFTEMTPEEFRRVTDVTYLGTVNGTRSALARMLPVNRGCIIQVGSALAERSIPLQSAYCGGKHGVRGFTDALRCELLHRKSGVQLTMVHLPAMNTPQFSWVRSRLPNHPQPVPPIFQPEVAADAILWVSRHRRREILVGMPTVKAFWGNRFIPGLLDHYLARIGYRSQQTATPVSAGRHDNLMEPVVGEFGCHGIFDSRSHSASFQLWMVKHRWLSLVLAGSAVAALAAATVARRSSYLTGRSLWRRA